MEGGRRNCGQTLIIACILASAFASLTLLMTSNEVQAQGIDYIVITDAPDGFPIDNHTYILGETDTFYCSGYNQTGAYMGLVDCDWASDNPNVGYVTPPFGTNVTFMAVGIGLTWVHATHADIQNQTFNDDTGVLIVLDNNVDYIVITDAPDGNPIGNVTYSLGDTDAFYCSGYNVTTGYTGLVSCYWYSDYEDVGTVEPPRGTSVTFATVGVGSTWVHATAYGTPDPGGTALHNVTGELKVVPDNIDYIVIVDLQNGTFGDWVGNRTYILGDTDIFYAMAYNDTQGPLGLVPVNWTTTNSTVCGITDYGTSTDFEALKEGTCKVIADFEGNYTNSTGTLTITKAGMITVDDDGPADYQTIQEAIDAANPGDTIFVYEGTYPEHVIVNKTVALKGEDEGLVIVTGSGSGTVFLVTADSVSISRFTIRDGEYGIFSDKTVALVIDHNIITNYTYGTYQNRTTDSWVTYNDISQGEYGIVTYEAHNDAIRHNDISYNTVYGAKDYNSQLKNCFNWNRFFKNKVAYYYDPDQELSTLEFDGNIIEDNEIGIKVYGASTVNLTNNTIRNNTYGVYLTEASPLVFNNSLEGNWIGVYCEYSSSLILQNTILGGDFGIYCENASPVLQENVIEGSERYAIFLDGASGSIVDNEVDGGIKVQDSSIDSISLQDSDVKSVNSTFDQVNLDSTSQIEVLWRLVVRVIDEDGNPVPRARVWVNDTFGSNVRSLTTGGDGWTSSMLVTQKIDTMAGSEVFNPYLVTAMKGDASGSLEATIVEDKGLILAIVAPAKGSGFWLPLELIIMLGSVIALGAGIGAFLSTEVGKFALLSLFLPLYTSTSR
ncbi:MAG: nitrous oxide reductase family maturation protein NosD [Thermoplasmata archaeon]